MWFDGCSLVPTHNLQTKLTTQNYANLSANQSSPSTRVRVIFRKGVSVPNWQPDNKRVWRKTELKLLNSRQMTSGEWNTIEQHFPKGLRSNRISL